MHRHYLRSKKVDLHLRTRSVSFWAHPSVHTNYECVWLIQHQGILQIYIFSFWILKIRYTRSTYRIALSVIFFPFFLSWIFIQKKAPNSCFYFILFLLFLKTLNNLNGSLRFINMSIIYEYLEHLCVNFDFIFFK